MKIFGQIVRTVVNAAVLPVAVVKDVFTLGGIASGEDQPYTVSAIEKIKDEASED